MSGWFRRLRRLAFAIAVTSSVAVAAATMGATSGTAASGPATGDGMPGSASAIAQALKLNPTFASLSLGITVGQSLADYTNQVGRAESRALDLGQIGATLASERCDGGDPTLPADQQPQPLRADSRDPKAAQGYSESEAWAPVITKSVRASAAPEGEAQTTAVALGDGKTLFVDGARSHAVAHVVDGATREARATADVGRLDLAGVVRMSGLHWEAVHHSGRDSRATGGFTIGSLTVAGVPVPTNDPAAALAAANTALAPLGIELRAPKSYVNDGVVFVDPLAVAVVPSATRDGITRPVLEAAYPVRKALADALLQASCTTSTYLTVADLLVGSVTGSGSFAVQLGGVQATSGAVKTSSYLQPLPALPPEIGPFDGGISELAGPAPSPSGEPSLAPSPAGTAPAAATTPAMPSRVTEAALPAAHTTGRRGGALAAVGLVGLLLILGAAETDRRMMRRAQRTTPMED